MTIQEDILVELTAEPITKIIGEPEQRDISVLEGELAEQVAKIKTTEDSVKGRKYGFLVLVLGQMWYGKVIGNDEVQWTTPKDPG